MKKKLKTAMMKVDNFNMEPGSIWEISYFMKDEIPLDPSVEQSIIDEYSRSMVQDTFNPPPGLSPSEYSQLFLQHFTKTREKSRELIENDVKVYRYSMLCQVGNLECMNELTKVENSSAFHRWENSSMVDFFKEISNQYL